MLTRIASGFLLGAVLWAQVRSPVSTETLFASLEELDTWDAADGWVAAEIKTFTLTERLDAEAFAFLKQRLPGPLAIAALQALAAGSAILPDAKPPAVSHTPALSAQEQKDILDRVTAYASSYDRRLPNFLCTETTRFYSNGKAAEWRLEQKVTEEVRYSNGAEDYRTVTVDDRPSTAQLSDLRASFSRGEFGSLLSATFDAASQTQFEWDRWQTVGAQRMAVFRFHVAREHSQYSVCCISAGAVTVGGVRRVQRKRWNSAYGGFIYADPESGVIRRMTFRNLDIPTGYNLDDGRNLLDFGPVILGGKTTWLPRRAIHYSRKGTARTRSDIEFSGFHSFEAASTIQFPTEPK